MSDKGQALMLLLGRAKGKGKDAGGDDAPAPDDKGDGGEDYDADLKAAVGDLASALGVTVKDPDKAIDALKTIHDLCYRAGGTE